MSLVGELSIFDPADGPEQHVIVLFCVGLAVEVKFEQLHQLLIGLV